KVTHEDQPPAKLLTYQTRGIDRDALTTSIVNTYLGNYDIVDSLSRKYGFDFRYFWPPYLTIGHKPLTQEERALARAVDPALLTLYESVYHSVVASMRRYPKLIDLTDVFDGHRELIWIDDMHVSPEGNLVIAKKIADFLNAPHPDGDRSH